MAPRRKFDFKFKEQVLQYAEENSGEKAARHFNIDSKRIRYWRKQKDALLLADKRRARLAGGGRKKVSVELERKLSEWIYSMWDKHEPVSGNMIINKALEIYPSVTDGGQMFVASRGWLQRFLQRNNFSLQRRRTNTTQRDRDLLTERLVSFVDFVGNTVSSKRISEEDIIAMDETAIWFDTRGGRGHEKGHLTVVLAAKADGTKLKPFIVFRGAADEVAVMQQTISSAMIATSVNGWMNDALTADWLQSVVGKCSLTPQLLVWDSYRCHISTATKAELKRGYDITAAVIPTGCTTSVHPADVMWKQTFKQSLRDTYEQWMAGDGDTTRGRVKGPAHRLLVDWVVSAWDKLDQDLIRMSFKVCGLSVKPDGSEDDLVLCLREGRPGAAGGRDALTRLRQTSPQSGFQATQEEEDEEELFNNELVVFDDDEEDDNDEDEDFGDEDSDHVSWFCFVHHAVPSNHKNRILIKEEQQEGNPSLDQENPPEPPHIKEEQEEVWTNQEAEIIKFTFSPVPVKTEDDDDDEEKPQSSQLHQRQTEQMETEADGEDCGGPEPNRNSEPVPEDKTGDSSEPETEDSDEWTETREPQSGLNSENESMWTERLCQ